jgi:hypothetical protein
VAAIARDFPYPIPGSISANRSGGKTYPKDKMALQFERIYLYW